MFSWSFASILLGLNLDYRPSYLTTSSNENGEDYTHWLYQLSHIVVLALYEKTCYQQISWKCWRTEVSLEQFLFHDLKLDRPFIMLRCVYSLNNYYGCLASPTFSQQKPLCKSANTRLSIFITMIWMILDTYQNCEVCHSWY